MPKRKPLTPEQAESRYQQAIDAAENLMGDSELAGEIESAGIDAWLESKGYTVKENPPTRRSEKIMATIYEGMTKAELIERCEAADAAMDAAWDFLLITDDSEYQGMSDHEKIEALEDSLESAIEEFNAFDDEQFPIDESDDTESTADDAHELAPR